MTTRSRAGGPPHYGWSCCAACSGQAEQGSAASLRRRCTSTYALQRDFASAGPYSATMTTTPRRSTPGERGVRATPAAALRLRRGLRDRGKVGALAAIGSAPQKQASLVVLDSPALGNLLRRQANIVRDLRLRVMNLRIVHPALHIFEPRASSRIKAPNVGVYADQEIAPSTLTPLLATVLERPVRAVPFQNIAEMARCLAQGQFAAASSQCPAQIAWAVIVEQDASLTVENFEREYENRAKRPPKRFVPDSLQLGIHVNSAGLLVVAPSANVPALRGPVPSSSTGVSIAAVPRTDGPVLVEQQARSPP